MLLVITYLFQLYQNDKSGAEVTVIVPDVSFPTLMLRPIRQLSSLEGV